MIMKTFLGFALLLATINSLCRWNDASSAFRKEINAIYQMQIQLSNTLKELAQVEQQLCGNTHASAHKNLLIEQKTLWHKVARIEEKIVLREAALASTHPTNKVQTIFENWNPIAIWTAIATARTTENQLACEQFSKLIELLQELAAVEQMIASCALDDNNPLDATKHEESIVLATRETLRAGITFIKERLEMIVSDLHQDLPEICNS